MKKILLTCLVTVLTTGMAYAATPCNQFEIKIINKLSDDLLVTTIDLKGADLQPGGIQKIGSDEAQVFTVNGSSDNTVMNGVFVFHTISIPSKNVKIKFDLKNLGLICEHTDQTPASDLPVEKTRLPGKVEYTISGK
jgi:hypothetical protein